MAGSPDGVPQPLSPALDASLDLLLLHMADQRSADHKFSGQTAWSLSGRDCGNTYLLFDLGQTLSTTTAPPFDAVDHPLRGVRLWGPGLHSFNTEGTPIDPAALQLLPEVEVERNRKVEDLIEGILLSQNGKVEISEENYELRPWNASRPGTFSSPEKP